MSIFKISEKFVLNKLKSIKEGNLKLVNYDGQRDDNANRKFG